MNRKEFYEAIAKDYFIEKTIDFEAFKDIVCWMMPIFGELEVEISEEDIDGDRKITFIDRDEADVYFAPEGATLSKEDLDMSCKALELIVNKDNIISIVESGVNMFTPANKELVLFLGSLVGKKILF